MLTYPDIADLVAAGQAAAQIATSLSANPVTVRGIPKAELRQWLAETGLLRFGVSGATGWMRLLYDANATVAPILDWLGDALQNPDVATIRTDQLPRVAGAMDALKAAYADPSAPAGIPVPVPGIDAKIDSWTGGRRYVAVTEAAVQAVIDAEDQRLMIEGLQAELAAALNNHVWPVEQSGDRAAIVAGLQAAEAAMTP